MLGESVRQGFLAEELELKQDHKRLRSLEDLLAQSTDKEPRALQRHS